MSIESFPSDHWVRIDLSHYTAGRHINAVWKESVPNKMTEFLRFSVDTDEVVGVVSGEILQCKLYEAGGSEIVRGSRCLITGLAKRETFPKEIIEFDYPYDITWADQLSKIFKDNLEIVLPSNMPFVVFDPGSSLIFNVLSTSTVPVSAHANSRFSYHVYLFNGSYSKYIELKARRSLTIPMKILAERSRR